MGSACCVQEGKDEKVADAEVVSVTRLPGVRGSWSYNNLDFSEEPKLTLCTGTLSLDGSDPEHELAFLLKYGDVALKDEGPEWVSKDNSVFKAKDAAFGGTLCPAMPNEEEVARLVESIYAGRTKLWDSKLARPLPAVIEAGVKGISPLHIASLPPLDTDLFNHTLFFSLEELIGFGVVWKEFWDRALFHQWTRMQREAVRRNRDILVLTKDDGSVGFVQSVEVLWLRLEEIPFRHMRASSFLLQGRPLLQAAKQEKDQMVRKLCLQPEVKTLLNHRGYSGYCPVHVLARAGKCDLLQLAIQAGAGVNVPIFNGAPPLSIASQQGHQVVVKQLIASRAEPDGTDEEGITALFRASQQGHEAVVTQLLKAGVELDRAKGDGCTPLFMASQQGHRVIVRQLLLARADMDMAKNSGSTPLFQACQEGHDVIVAQLLAERADPNKEKGTSRATPLLIACEKGHEKVVKRLLAGRADHTRGTSRGTTPLSAARRRGYGHIARLIVAAGGQDPPIRDTASATSSVRSSSASEPEGV